MPNEDDAIMSAAEAFAYADRSYDADAEAFGNPDEDIY